MLRIGSHRRPAPGMLLVLLFALFGAPAWLFAQSSDPNDTGDMDETEVMAEEVVDDDAAPEDMGAPAAAADRTAEQHYADFVHYIMIGRFDIAASEGKLLLQDPEATPDNVRAYADKYRNSREAILRVSGDPTLGPIVTEVMKVIHEGERNVRKDPKRIKGYIEDLLGPPRSELYAIQKLQESGEYAIPWIIAALEDPTHKNVTPRLVSALPKIGKDALNPLVQALNVPDEGVRLLVIQSLGRIGYAQALPYLKRLAESSEQPANLKAAAQEAITTITGRSGESAGMSSAEMFVRLGEAYYNNAPIVRADPRLEVANVWYWTDGALKPIEVPQFIWNEVMSMRCCESALALSPSMPSAIGLWLSSDFRREAELEMDPTSESSDPREALDATRPDNFPRAIYFARSAGPRYNQLVLARAVRDGDIPVALGAIAALGATAGPDNVVPDTGLQAPLASALTFPDLLVRLKAAIVLGGALPRGNFVGSERVVPTLAEALAQTGQTNALVVDPDESNRNRVQGMLREDGVAVVSANGLFDGMTRARQELPTVDVVFIASDVKSPGLADSLKQLKGDFAFSTLPIVLMVKPDDRVAARAIASGDTHLQAVLADAPKTTMLRAWQTVAARVGKTPVSGAEALQLALRSAEVLRQIAVSNSQVFPFGQAVNALIGALAYPEEELRIKAASVLALTDNPAAQAALAEVATDPQQTTTLRVAAFNALAECAGAHGNQLPSNLVDRLLDQAMNAGDMTIRVNASKAIGALNLPSDITSKIITAYQHKDD